MKVAGRLVDSRGRPKANAPVDLFLPGSYGLAGLDAVWGKPEDYGHDGRTVTVRTDSVGHFDHLFPSTTYSGTLFLIPPIGFYPKQPPQPYFVLRDPGGPRDIYIIGAMHGRFDYRVRDPATGALHTDPTQRVSGDFVLREFPASDTEKRSIPGWQANVKIVVP